MGLTLEAAGTFLLWPFAFVLFRLFDIRSPWPVRLAGDVLPGGWGVMADDVLAAGCRLRPVGVQIRSWHVTAGALSAPPMAGSACGKALH